MLKPRHDWQAILFSLSPADDRLHQSGACVKKISRCTDSFETRLPDSVTLTFFLFWCSLWACLIGQEHSANVSRNLTTIISCLRMTDSILQTSLHPICLICHCDLPQRSRAQRVFQIMNWMPVIVFPEARRRIKTSKWALIDLFAAMILQDVTFASYTTLWMYHDP